MHGSLKFHAAVGRVDALAFSSTRNLADSLTDGIARSPSNNASKGVGGRFPIVGIGMSAGRLEVATTFLKAMPAHSGMGFVIVQHLVLDTNLFGPLGTIRAVLPSMRAARSGLIINISFVLSFRPAPFMGIYASSKHALGGLSESLDHEIREFNVRVVLIEPTFTNTNLDVNAKHTGSPLGVYASQASATINTVESQIKSAPSPSVVANQILAAINGPYRMRQLAGGQATLLSRLRRFMPASAGGGD